MSDEKQFELPASVGRLDDVVEAIREGDRERALELLHDECKRRIEIEDKEKEEWTRRQNARHAVQTFGCNLQNDNAFWLKARRACGWSGVEGFEWPVETLPPVKPAFYDEASDFTEDDAKVLDEWMKSKLKPLKPKPRSQLGWAVERARLACKVGRDGINGEQDLPDGVTGLEWAVYNLLHAVEDVANAVELMDRGAK